MKWGYLVVAITGALGLVVAWASHPTAKIQGNPRPSRKAAFPLEEAFPPPGEDSKDAHFVSAQGAVRLSPRPAEPIGTPSAPPQPVLRRGPQGGQWGHLNYLKGVSAGQGEAGRQEALHRTATYLSIDAARVSEFEDAARQSVIEMEQALDVRKGELSTPVPPGGSAVAGEQERLSQERYAAARSKALDRLERFLAQSTVHQEFRWSFDSWASMVANKTRGLDQ